LESASIEFTLSTPRLRRFCFRGEEVEVVGEKGVGWVEEEESKENEEKEGG
jgi:hypothetical protein